jgi:riboflavin biosynthesis pyrimidine reductase
MPESAGAPPCSSTSPTRSPSTSRRSSWPGRNPSVLNSLGEHFVIRRLLLEGGGHINGAFLEAGLVDQVSLLIAPGIDGRHGVAAVFDGLKPRSNKAFSLKLKSMERREKDTIWLRYERQASGHLAHKD